MTEENPLSKLLRPHVARIKTSAAGGNRQAAQIIQLYRMYQDCPNDPGAPALCEQFFREWAKDQKIPVD